VPVPSLLCKTQLVPGALGPFVGELAKLTTPAVPPLAAAFQLAPPFSNPGLSGPRMNCACNGNVSNAKVDAAIIAELTSDQELNSDIPFFIIAFID
jgi:hypothetical protein